MICKETQTCFFRALASPLDVHCSRKDLCIEFCDQRSDAACTEKGKTYHLLNTKGDRHKILSVHIDGGAVVTDKQTPPNVSKCDYLYLVDTAEKPMAVLIELKGKKFLKAVDQIQNTLDLFRDAFDRCGKVYGRIVFAGGTPNIRNIPSVMSLTRALKRRGGGLEVGERMTDKIEDLLG